MTHIYFPIIMSSFFSLWAAYITFPLPFRRKVTILEAHSAGTEEPTLPGGELVPVIIGTIIIGILIIYIYGAWIRVPLKVETKVETKKKPKRGRYVPLCVVWACCSDGKFRLVVVDLHEPSGGALTLLYGGVADVHEGRVTITWIRDRDRPDTIFTCFFTNTVYTPAEAMAFELRLIARVDANPNLDFVFTEFPIHNPNVTHHNGVELEVASSGRPLRFSFGGPDIPVNPRFPYAPRQGSVRHLIESRTLTLVAHTAILTPVDINNQYT